MGPQRAHTQSLGWLLGFLEDQYLSFLFCCPAAPDGETEAVTGLPSQISPGQEAETGSWGYSSLSPHCGVLRARC